MEVKPSYKGAEAYLYEVRWGDKKALAKMRIEKQYRHKLVDTAIRRGRTIAEARSILAALEAGVPAPAIYYVDEKSSIIVFEKLNGRLLRDLIEEKGVEGRILKAVKLLGRYVGLLHEHGIVHGDLTTSNVIVLESEAYKPIIIDFGLAERSINEEDKAIDIHLFLRSLESTHPEYVSALYKAFMEGYEEIRGCSTRKLIEEHVKKIRLMGRYVEERRKRKTLWELKLEAQY